MVIIEIVTVIPEKQVSHKKITVIQIVKNIQKQYTIITTTLTIIILIISIIIIVVIITILCLYIIDVK